MDEISRDRFKWHMDDLLSRACEFLIKEISSLKAVYIFGSYSDGSAQSESDLDIAVVGAKPLDVATLFDLRLSLGERLSKSIDLVDLLQINPVLGVEITETGRRMFCKKGAEAEMDALEVRIMSEYLHLNEERKEILEEIEARGSIRG